MATVESSPGFRSRGTDVGSFPVVVALLVAAAVFLVVGSLRSATFAQLTVQGLALGAVYGSLALALVLVYRATRVINFAQGEMAMFSTFIAWSLVHHGLSYWAAFVLTIGISFVGGVLVERAVIRPVEDAPVLTVVIVTLGLFFLVNGAARWIWSPETRSLPNAFSTRPCTVYVPLSLKV